MKSNRKKGDKGERRAAKKYGGSMKPGSGSIWVHKGDVSTDEEVRGYKGLHIQNKVTDRKSFSLSYDKFKANLTEAMVDDRMPIFRVEFTGRDTVIMIPEWLFESLLEE